MTKQELQEWVDLIPDDIFEKVYALDPVNKYAQLDYSAELIKTHFKEVPVSFDENGFIQIEQPYGRLVFT